MPVGKNKDWYKPPRNQLKYRFRDSPILPLITSEAQREITYDLGMMASPAVGSLLFSLKELDREEDNKPNFDEAYNEMLNDAKERRIVVCGSSVGGTGSSVAPTLARLCNDKGAEVMAVMVHDWFQFTRPDDNREKFDLSVERNKCMKQNAAGGLACYGSELAGSVPTVLVGVPAHARILRDYTTDNQQQFQDSYAHAVGALAGIKHFLTGREHENKIKKGLYGVSASDPSRLTGDTVVEEGVSLRTMVGHAQFLVYLLKVYSRLLRVTSKRDPSIDKSSFFKFFDFAGHTPFPSIVDWAYTQLDRDHSSLEYVANELDSIVNNYEELLVWSTSLPPKGLSGLEYDTSHVEKKSKQFFLPELKCIERLNSHFLPGVAELQKSRLANLENVEIVALALFHWVADWIADDWKKINPEPVSEKLREGQGYWPDVKFSDDTGLVPTWKKPGELGKVADGKIITTIGNHFDSRDVSSNSWPHPFAVVEQFKFQITNKDPVALRKLEILLVGRALNVLEFERVQTGDNKGNLSLERLFEDEGIAEYCLIHKESGKVYGFNSPDTLLCPAPDVSDEDWEALRKDFIASDWNGWHESENWNETLTKAGKYALHGLRSTVGRIRGKVSDVEQEKINWKYSTNWGDQGEKARKCIKGWLKCTEGYIKDTVDEDSRTWMDVFDEYFNSETGPFGVAEWLPLPAEKVRVPVPILGASIHLFDDAELDKQEAGRKCQEFLDRVSGFKECTVTRLGKSETFQLVQGFLLPGEDYPIQAIWREHLDGLQEMGIIFAWQMDQTDRGVWIREKLGDQPIFFRDLQVIDLDAIQIITCIPLEQRPVSGSRSTELKYPDIPLRPEYIDLLKVPKGEKNEGEKCIHHDVAWRALEQSGEVDKASKVVRWKLDLSGRSEPVSITVSVENIEPAKAHWMIWPNIKSPFHPDTSNYQWRAYYVYEHSDRKSLEARTIYLDQKGNLSAIKKAPPGCPGNSYALDFKGGQHVGGPPVALSAYDHKLKLDTGIYVISLQEYSSDKEPWKLAIDFGTSHTVAAYQINEEKGAESVNLDAELATDDGLSLHVSENYDVRDISEIGPDIWRPTYSKEASGEISRALLPSDLWSIEDLKYVKQERFESEWSPMTHYSIPAMQLRRSNLQDHIISGFKWDLDKGEFRGEEQWLRRRYLRMAIEIFVADIVKKTRTLPKEIVTTFTYPLRGTITQATDNYEKVVNRVLEASRHDLGIRFRLCDNQGMYSESHAASDSVGNGIPINVKLVADLGGGTLDLLISTFDIPSQRENNRFDEVEDSVQIGSDILLRVLAGNPLSYLPKGEDRGWEKEKAFEQLRAWMRSVGSDKLFGMDSKNWHDPNLKLTGFERRQDGNHARELINRYFRIIIDFLARYLVAYVAKDVLPELKSDSDREKLKLLVNLRGNGWRLWHGSRNYGDIQREMESLVKVRAAQLWTEAGLTDALPDSVWHRADLIEENSPKLAPIKKAVGRSMDPELARKRSHRFPLSKVAIFGQGQEDKQLNWCEKSPFKGVSAAESLHVDEFDPPLVIHAPESGDALKKIEDELMKAINDSISGNQAIRDPLRNTVDAPIAVLIWENVLKSDKFRKI
ncbi:MAG: hypothetical protein F4120_01195 [Rhodothermaceae bacterium]|nr:hypothetical protein [Rhodothermaceae bacterium]